MNIYCKGEQVGGIYSPIHFFESKALFNEECGNYQDNIEFAVLSLKKDLQEKADLVSADALVSFFLKISPGTDSKILITARATAVKFA